ncbi:hypothetical protein CBR64_19580 [Cellulosimicrobium cellulans]|uniref:Uncharacterized protein n=1 Tax=Cellulosimicrobium cellulans TaxID=1710 RepID=A0A1Y0HYP0_CELCE|nr:hypothetical protein [Cellulosimicrobium cellulans]ARU53302.1 hypothetical protein CBR64_19580 [Cellulosimicrobium cellulans]
MTTSALPDDDRVELLWLPVGADGRVVRRTSAWWERACALAERRRPRPLFHAALDVRLGGVPYTVEMTPRGALPRPTVASSPPDRSARDRWAGLAGSGTRCAAGPTG